MYALDYCNIIRFKIYYFDECRGTISESMDGDEYSIFQEIGIETDEYLNIHLNEF